MLLIVRLICKENLKVVWDCLIENLKGKETKKVKPLYLSQLRGENYIGVIFNVEKIDYLVKFLVEEVAKIAECGDIEETKTLTLMKPVFLPIPKDRPGNLCRYMIFFKVEPRYYHDVYNELLEYRYGTKIFPTYIAYSLGEFDIVLSVLSGEPDEVQSFIKENICKQERIKDCKICPIERSELLVKKETWRRLQRSLLHIPAWIPKEDLKKHFLYDYDMSVEDYCKLTGAMIDEL